MKPSFWNTWANIDTQIYKYYKDKRQHKEKKKQHQHQQLWKLQTQIQQKQAGSELNIELADVIHQWDKNVSVYIYIWLFYEVE